jgi:hypothetical protein
MSQTDSTPDSHKYVHRSKYSTVLRCYGVAGTFFRMLSRSARVFFFFRRSCIYIDKISEAAGMQIFDTGYGAVLGNSPQTN